MATDELENPGSEEEAGELDTLAEVEHRDPTDMTQEELDNFLSGETPAESESTDEGGEEGDEEEGGEDDPAAGAEGGEEEEDPKDKGGTETSPEIKKLLDEIEALKKKTANQDKFFDRMGTEVGLLRKKTPEEDLEKIQEIRDAYAEDPVEGHRLMEEYKANQVKSESLQNEYAANRSAETNREALSERLPDMEKAEVVNELATMMAEDGAPAQAVEVFKQNPFLMDQATLYNLYQRRSLSKENVDLKTQLEVKEKEIAELKGKPEKMLEKLEKASRGKQLPRGSAGSKKAAAKTEKKTANLTGEELDALLSEK
ncbi:hypothetical protein KAR91_39400 [Candidatus Pacearchaeota archaeon]|nr:hypothetical protein [Candidatus Pacearchaeota archaeon]